jgi:2-polyprenyl-3-methyl-5-hydroxy-6-metoxy-1,4-benzoquinol methylase
MTSKGSWSRKRAIDVHDETAHIFSDEYASDNAYDSPFRYGRHLIDQAWAQIVSELPKGAQCLDIGSGIGAYMARLLKAGFEVQGIEPSAEMRTLAAEHVPSSRVTDGSVLDLAAFRQSQDFIYAIEVFRYLDTNDNVVGHKEILRALKPGGIYFGTYVNRWAASYKTKYSSPFTNSNGVLTSVGTAYINASQQFTSQSVGVSLNRVF